MIQESKPARRTTVALVCPDGYSVLLFCKGIIAALAGAGWGRILVLTEVGEHRNEIEALGVECVDIPVSRFLDPVGDFRYLAALARTFQREKCDAVLNFSTKPNIFGTLAAKLARRRRIVIHVVGQGATFVPDDSLRHHAMRTLMRGLYRVACGIARRVWFTNPSDRAYFVESGLVEGSKTMLTRNYLDTGYYAESSITAREAESLRAELALAPEAIVVVMVARLIWPKGIGEFAEAARILRASHPHAVFLLVAPPEPPSAQTVPVETVRGYESGGNFRWLGFRRDMRAIYALCDVAVLPTYYKEGGYPRALLEPMSMGKPLVASTSEDCRGTVDEGKNGFLVPPRDGAALARAIGKLLDSAELRANFGAASRIKAVTEFDEKEILRGAIAESGLYPTE